MDFTAAFPSIIQAWVWLVLDCRRLPQSSVTVLQPLYSGACAVFVWNNIEYALFNMDYGLLVVDYGLLIMDYWLWIVDYCLWVIDCGLLVIDCGSWIIGY